MHFSSFCRYGSPLLGLLLFGVGEFPDQRCHASEPITNSEAVASKPVATEASEPIKELIFPLNSEHNHAPGIVELDDGQLLVTWFRGSGERKADDVKVMGSRKSNSSSFLTPQADSGTPYRLGAWSEAFTMIDTEGFPDCNTSLFLRPDGKLVLFWPVIIANTWESAVTNFVISDNYLQPGAPQWLARHWLLMKPDDFSDSAKRYLDQFCLDPTIQLSDSQRAVIDTIRGKLDDKLHQRLGWQPRCKPTLLKSGRILLPLYSDTYSFSIMAISDDGGESWKSSKPLLGFGNIQPAVLERQDGSLVAYMRENGATGHVRACESTDQGETWGDIYSTPLLNPGSGLDALKLQSGKWILIYNDTTDGRHRLAISMSDDEGSTWKWTKHLEDEAGKKFHYPAVIQSRDGRIHTVYSYFESDGKSIVHSTFTEEWLAQP